MRASIEAIPLRAIPLALLVEAAVSAILAAALLDALVRRPAHGGGSITTLLPGFVYACATVMKVCVVGLPLSALLAWVLPHHAPGGRAPAPPVWGLAAAAIPPLTPLIGALAVVGIQAVLTSFAAPSTTHYQNIARGAVFAMLAALLAGTVAAAISLLRGERPRLLPVLALVANLVPVCLFCHLRFFALGFDQDRWAPPDP